jgi:8-oxo-dGTP diphosphatase
VAQDSHPSPTSRSPLSYPSRRLYRRGRSALAARFPAAFPPELLGLDHDRILVDGLEHARAKLEYSPLATAFCADEFTVAELRHVYEVAWGTRLDTPNFHGKVAGSPFWCPRPPHPQRRTSGAALPPRRRDPPQLTDTR